MIFKLPWPILELTELESKLKLRLTILYHNFLGVSQSADKFTVSAILRVRIFYIYVGDICNIGKVFFLIQSPVVRAAIL
jgi:hypothetical protein